MDKVITIVLIVACVSGYYLFEQIDDERISRNVAYELP